MRSRQKADSDLHLRTDGSFHCMFYVGGSGGRLYSIVQFSASCIFLFSYFGSALFTISCILIPGTDCIVYQGYRKISVRTWILLIAGNLTAVAIPILCVSRFQLLFAVGFAAVMYLMLYKKITWKMMRHRFMGS